MKILSSAFLGTREPERSPGLDFMCHIPFSAKVRCFSIHAYHFSSMPVPTCTTAGTGSSAITPINGALYRPPTYAGWSLKYSAPFMANTNTSRERAVFQVMLSHLETSVMNLRHDAS